MNTYKSHFVRGAALIFAVILMASFVACKKIPTLTPDVSGGYVNDKTGVIYYDAPGSYSAKTYLSEEAVAINDGINFYAVEGAENETWLYSPDFGILLYAESETLPALKDLAPVKMDISLENDGLTSTIYEIENTQKINSILDAYENGETLKYPGTRANYKFYLKFYSAEYPWLVYNLMFVQYAEDLIVNETDENGEVVAVNYGKNFIYDRFEDRFVAIGEEFQGYIDDYYHNADAV